MKYKKELENLSKQGLTIDKISTVIGLSSTGTRYWLKKYGIKTTGNKRKDKWSEEILRKFISESKTKSDVLRKMNLLVRPGNFRTLDRYISIYNIDTHHFDRKFHKNRFNNIKYSDEDIFKKNSDYSNMKSLKSRILRKGLIDYKCSSCENIGEWNNKKLNLQLDHINGDHRDNRLENLRFMCPNCHSQTETFCSKNRWKGGVHGVHDCLKSSR